MSGVEQRVHRASGRRGPLPDDRSASATRPRIDFAALHVRLLDRSLSILPVRAIAVSVTRSGRVTAREWTSTCAGDALGDARTDRRSRGGLSGRWRLDLPESGRHRSAEGGAERLFDRGRGRRVGSSSSARRSGGPGPPRPALTPTSFGAWRASVSSAGNVLGTPSRPRRWSTRPISSGADRAAPDRGRRLAGVLRRGLEHDAPGARSTTPVPAAGRSAAAAPPAPPLEAASGGLLSDGAAEEALAVDAALDRLASDSPCAARAGRAAHLRRPDPGQ